MTNINLKNFRMKMEMEIPEISKLESIWSKEIPIHGIPWKFHVVKNGQDAEQCLAIYLHCANKDKSPNWALCAAASFKLLPFSGDANPTEFHVSPYTFDASGNGRGTSNLIKWNDLFDPNKKYVKDDTIKLDIEVTAENPNDSNRSRLNFKFVQKCYDNSHVADIRLTVTNVLNLMALQSPQFMLRGLPWDIQVSKMHSSHLGVLLRLCKDSEKDLSKMAMTIQLISSKKDVQPIEKYIIKEYQHMKNNIPVDIVSWDELVKPENGFINDDSITLELELGEPDANGAPVAKRAKPNPENEIKTPQLECPICLKCIANQKLAVTRCGHLFCFECIKKAIAGRAACPVCNKAVRSNTLRQLYLPGVN